MVYQFFGQLFHLISSALWFVIDFFGKIIVLLATLLFNIFNVVFVILDKLTLSFLSNTFLNKKAIGRNAFRYDKSVQKKSRLNKSQKAKLRLVEPQKIVEKKVEKKAEKNIVKSRANIKKEKIHSIKNKKSSVNKVSKFLSEKFTPVKEEPVKGRKGLVEEYMKEYERSKSSY